MTTTTPRATRRNRQFWLEHVSQWKTSGLSKAAYCERHQLKPGSFYNWSRPRELDPSAGSDSGQASAVKFLPVTLTAAHTGAASASSVVRVERADTHLDLPADLPADQM